MSGNKNKLTKQGIRDLNHIVGKSVGRKYVAPPVEAMICEHRNIDLVDDENGESECRSCAMHFDHRGRMMGR